MKPRKPDSASEQRLDEIRREAEATGRVDGRGIRPGGAPLPAEPSYHGLPLLKPPVWTWEIPTYFFVGGAAGAAAVIGFAARVGGGNERLVRDARFIAAAGGALSGVLLVADLGRPERFLNMLRVFKPQSAMSVGAWIVAAFGATSAAAMLLPRRAGDAAAFGSAVTGLGMATYTGVLLGATSIPVWSQHVAMLPAHFGASAVGAATSALELRGRRDRALNRLAIAAAAFETVMAPRIDTNMRVAAALSGPVPLVLRLLAARSRKMRQAAAVSTLVGSLLTRIAWVEAGKASASRVDGARVGDPIRKREQESDSTGQDRQ
jgi:formate-dependent nitrite reductase membrane component NrfD